MAKLQADTILTVNMGGRTFKKGTTKDKLIAMSVELGSFTKEQWLAEAVERYELGSYAHSMIVENNSTLYWAKAWWNEFYAKAEVFEPTDSPSDMPEMS